MTASSGPDLLAAPAARTVITGCAIATVDPAGTEYSAGHLVIEGSRISALGEGPAPAELLAGATVIDGRGLLATPGLINSHHHLYQWSTRGFVPDGTLFEWLTGLYPVWAQLDDDITHHAAKAGLSQLALSGCTLSTDHHYVFPNGAELLEATITAAQAVGIRFHPCRGSMDLGHPRAGCRRTPSPKTSTRFCRPAPTRSTAGTTPRPTPRCRSRWRLVRRSR